MTENPIIWLGLRKQHANCKRESEITSSVLQKMTLTLLNPKNDQPVTPHLGTISICVKNETDTVYGNAFSQREGGTLAHIFA